MGRCLLEEGGGPEGGEVLDVEVEEGGALVEREDGAEEEGSVKEGVVGGARDEAIRAVEAIGVRMEFVRLVEAWEVEELATEECNKDDVDGGGVGSNGEVIIDEGMVGEAWETGGEVVTSRRYGGPIMIVEVELIMGGVGIGIGESWVAGYSSTLVTLAMVAK